MCGLVGFVDFHQNADEYQLSQMNNALYHRGPDGVGNYFINSKSYNLGLGHRRLSIIDLSPLGKQPMTDATGRLSIVYNGEVYNYKEIREDLLNKGYRFISESDTEVILNAYLEWGLEAVHRFIGMFAFAIFDRKEERVVIFRDRAGVKPLYYYWHNGLFLFASELKAFHSSPGFVKKVDTNSLYKFLQYSFVPAPYSIFENTYKLEPGHYLELDLKKSEIHTNQYWDVLKYYESPKLNITEEVALGELESRLKKAFDYRMVSDVPVGVFLSGGYDSTLVAALLQKDRTEKIKTFTIGFAEEKFNEAIHAKKVAGHLGTDHHEMYCSYKEAQEIIPELPFYYDEPFADSSAIPTILVSRFARKHVTVALSADGGDELFAGYTKYSALQNHGKKTKAYHGFIKKILGASLRQAPSPVLKIFAKGRNIAKDNISKYADFFSGKIDEVDLANFANQTAMPEFIKRFCNFKIEETVELFETNRIRKIEDNLSRFLAIDYLSYLPGDILTKVDRATMSVSLEGREPLLDQHIIEWVAMLPANFKIKNGTSKYMLRKIVHKYVPEHIMNRPKMGFSIPVNLWLRHELKYLFEKYLSVEAIAKHELFNANEVQLTLRAYYLGDESRFPFLWSLLMFQMWFEKWM
ncbi:MAG: asparagine synthase (glutamine-hydrolyzing) [Chitinophagaceae bacterium]|nr:asparagine synthase (glutamine-hydrolyzing) [Chitinophagaceae bacterium]